MLALGLVPSQIALSRLEIRISVAERHMTYAEFGAWVGRNAGVPVTVAPALAERKMAIFVKDRPLEETMRRVAEALFLKWEPSGAGFSLRLQPKVAAEEAATLGAARGERAARFQREIESAIRLARHQGDPLEGALRQAEREVQSTQGAGDGAEAQARIVFERAQWEVAARRAFGTVWLALPPERREALLAGTPVIARSGEGARTLDLPPAVAEETRRTFGQGEHGLRVTVRPLDDGLGLKLEAHNAGFTLGGPLPSFIVRDGALDRRLTDWARWLDSTVPETKPLSTGETAPRRPLTGGLSLGDALATLHDRTGLPIVGDGSRMRVGTVAPPQDKTVWAWLNALDNGPNQSDWAYRCRARSDGGWLMVRAGRYWDRLAAEVPERAARALEAAGKQPGGPGLDDYAAFAAAMSPEAERWAPYLALDVPLTPIVYTRNVPFLRLWNALSAAQRAAARSKGGLAVARMSPNVQARCASLLATRLDDFDPPDEAMAVAIGLAPIPPDLRLFVGEDSDDPRGELLEADLSGRALPVRIGPRASEGLVASLGRLGRPALVNFVLALRSVRRD